MSAIRPTESSAAITIQRAYRNHKSLKPAFDRAAAMMDLCENHKYNKKGNYRIKGYCTQANIGACTVHFPKGIPQVVLKYCTETKNSRGSLSAYGRLNKMDQGRSVLKEIGSKHLIIPLARIHKRELIEQRLPVDCGFWEQTTLYLNNPEKFTAAIQELTEFCRHAHIGDLINHNNNTGFIQSSGPMIRYDNLPIYLENGVGKIGLIDLEQLTLTKDLFAPEIATLAQIFPLHIEEILKVAEKYEPTIRSDSYVKLKHKEARTALRSSHSDHPHFANQPLFKVLKPLEEMRATLETAIATALPNLSFYFLKENKEEAFKQITTALPEVLYESLSNYKNVRDANTLRDLTTPYTYKNGKFIDTIASNLKKAVPLLSAAGSIQCEIQPILLTLLQLLDAKGAIDHNLQIR